MMNGGTCPVKRMVTFSCSGIATLSPFASTVTRYLSTPAGGCHGSVATNCSPWRRSGSTAQSMSVPCLRHSRVPVTPWAARTSTRWSPAPLWVRSKVQVTAWPATRVRPEIGMGGAGPALPRGGEQRQQEREEPQHGGGTHDRSGLGVAFEAPSGAPDGRDRRILSEPPPPDQPRGARARHAGSEFVRRRSGRCYSSTSMTLDPEICWRAWTSRDRRFDGRFFMGVDLDRHLLPARLPGARCPRGATHASTPTPAAAEAAGFRPCLRCRPETAPGSPARHGTSAHRAARAAPDRRGRARRAARVEALADRLGVTSRWLRELFAEHVGASPLEVAMHAPRALRAPAARRDGPAARRHRARATGFGERAPAARRDPAHVPPRAVAAARPRAARARRGALALRVPARAPFDAGAAARVPRARAIPGVEQVDGGDVPAHASSLDGRAARRSRSRRAPRRASACACAGARAAAALPRAGGARDALFDLDADAAAIAAHLVARPAAAPRARRARGARAGRVGPVRAGRARAARPAGLGRGGAHARAAAWCARAASRSRGPTARSRTSSRRPRRSRRPPLESLGPDARARRGAARRSRARSPTARSTWARSAASTTRSRGSPRCRASASGPRSTSRCARSASPTRSRPATSACARRSRAAARCRPSARCSRAPNAGGRGAPTRRSRCGPSRHARRAARRPHPRRTPRRDPTPARRPDDPRPHADRHAASAPVALIAQTDAPRRTRVRRRARARRSALARHLARHLGAVTSCASSPTPPARRRGSRATSPASSPRSTSSRSSCTARRSSARSGTRCARSPPARRGPTRSSRGASASPARGARGRRGERREPGRAVRAVPPRHRRRRHAVGLRRRARAQALAASHEGAAFAAADAQGSLGLDRSGSARV